MNSNRYIFIPWTVPSCVWRLWRWGTPYFSIGLYPPYISIVPFYPLTFIEIPGTWDTRTTYLVNLGWEWITLTIVTSVQTPRFLTWPRVYPGCTWRCMEIVPRREKERMEQRGFQRESHPSFGYGEGGPPRFSIYLCPPYLYSFDLPFCDLFVLFVIIFRSI